MKKNNNIFKQARALLMLLFLLINIFANAQNNINRVEYFFDADPGFGLATSIPITANTNITDQIHSIDISAVSNGFHSFFIRSRDDSGSWSLSVSSIVFRANFGASSNAPIVKAEYFFDADPGFGNATPISLSSSNNISDVILAVDISTVSNGFHSFYIRSQDANGVWSLTNTQSIFKAGSTSAIQNIVATEYFFDTDPGFGNGNAIAFTPSTNVADQILAINIAPLSNGFHSFFIRSKDANGNWSLTNSSAIFKTSNGSAISNITKAEFFVDTDPGFGNATNIPITAGLNISNYVATVVNPHTLSAGVHNFFLRTQDANGIWSLSNSVAYTVYPNSQYENIALTGCGSVTYKSVVYTANAIVVDSFKSVNFGYDSLVRTATIVVNPKYNFTQTINLNGCNSVTYNSIAYTNSTSFIDTVKTTKGCDSIYKTINIIVYNVATATTTETLIGCGSYTFNSINYTSNITVRDTVKSVHQCDSIYNIHNIVIITPTTQNVSVLGCGSVTYNSNVYNSSTVVHDTLKSATGCDSVFKNVTIIVVNPFTLNYSLSGCNSVNYNSNNYTSSTIVHDTIKSSLGCDSVYNVVTINVTTITPVNQVVKISGCNSVIYNATTYTNSTTLNQTLSSYQGCDSVYRTINITVHHLTPTTHTTNVSGCNSVIYNTITYTSSTILRDTIKSVVSNCDSIYNVVNIAVTIVNAASQTINVSGCDSATYNSITYFASTTLHDTLYSYQGCDSVYKTINITVQVKPTITITASVNPVCSTNPTTLTASGGGNYTWSPATALSNTSGVSVTASPANTITYTVTSNQTCVVSKTITITTKPLPTIDAGANQTILLGSSTTLTATGGVSYSWNTGDTTATISVSPISNTNYIVTGTAANGCTAQDLVTVSVNFTSLAVNTNNYNFGNVVVNTTANTNIIVTNNGTLPIMLNGVTTANPYTSSIAVQSIAANASVSIPVSFNPTATLFYVNSLTINTSIGNFVVTLQGRGVAPAPSWVITPSTRSFANTLVNDSSTQTFTVFNTGNIPIAVSSIGSSNAVFTGVSSSNTIAVGGNATVTVKYKPTAIGVNNATININSSTPSLAAITATVTGSGYVNNVPPTLHFVSATPYNSSNGVNPILGQAGTYTYRILYRSTTNTAPQLGYPKVGIDKNGDGDYIDNDEGVYTMNQLNTTNNWVAGEEFTFSTNLAIGNLYGYRFMANDSLGNPATATNTSHNNGPNVTDQTLDLSIYANDISFSVAHPAVGQTFTVFATVHNNTPYSASNVNIRFYTDSIYYNQTTLPFIGANSTATISMNFVYNLDGFYPIKVWIDSTNNLGETNALNNYAIRPIIVGNFTVPGAILVTANSSTQTCPTAVVFSGTAVYSGLNLVGNPPVLGALVSIKVGGVTIATTYTITNGNWSVYVSRSCGIENYTVEVTDFTLTGTRASQSYSIACGVSCDPPTGSTDDLNISPRYEAAASPLPCCIIANTPFTNSYTFTNKNTYKYTKDTVLVYADDTLKYTYTADSLLPNQSLSYNSSFNFHSGNHTFKYFSIAHYSYKTGRIDTSGGGFTLIITTHSGRILDSSIVNIYIDTPKADMSLSEFSQIAIRSLSVKVGNATCINAPASKLYIYETNATYDSASKVLLDSVATTAINAGKCNDTRVVLNYTNSSWTQGYHYIILKADGGNAVDETLENNNELQTTIYVPQPEVLVQSIEASNSNVHTGDAINFVATIRNNGSTANNFKVQFLVNGIALGSKQTIATLASNSSTALSSVVYNIPAGNCPIKVTVIADVDNDLVELNENNNIDSISFGSDVNAGVACYYAGSSCSPYTIYIGNPLNMTSIVRNIGLRDVDTTHIRFKIGATVIGSDNINHIAANSFATTSLVHTFNTVGNYVIAVEADYNSLFCETNEGNNIGYIYVNAVNALADLRILSQHISPSNLNPVPGQTISVVSSVQNIGNLASTPAMVRFWIDDVQLGVDVAINAIQPGRDTTIAATITYSNLIVGPKIIKVRADINNQVLETDTTNNAATRAIIVGGAPDFARTINEGITFNRNLFRVGKQITISNYIRNYGGDTGRATLNFYYRTATAKTLISSVPFRLNDHDSIRIATNWIVAANNGNIITEIVNATPQEFNTFNNIDSIAFVTDTSTPSVSITPNLLTVCQGASITFIAASQNVIAPLYIWKINGILTGDTATNITKILNVGDIVTCDLYDEEMFLNHAANIQPIIKPKSYSSITATICPSQLPYIWNLKSYLVSGNYNDTFVNSIGCDSIATLHLTVYNNVSWKTNAIDSNWNNALNWQCGVVPTANDTVSILANSVIMPVIASNVNIYKLINSGTLSIAATSTLSIAQNIEDTGTIATANGGVICNGIVPQSISNKLNVYSLQINNIAGVSLTNQATILGVLVPTTGTVNTNGHLILASNAMATARVDRGNNAGGYINGTVTVQRYIPGKRAWRFLTAPLSSNGFSNVTLNNSWQQATHIVGPSGVGLDAVKPAYSMQYFNNNNWVNINNTTTTNLFTNDASASTRGFAAFIVGDRSTSNLTIPNFNSTTLSASGKLLQGNQLFALGNKTQDEYLLIGNPYASPVDFDAVYQNLATTNVYRTMFTWDPMFGGSTSTGGYITVSYDGIGGYDIVPNGTSQTQHIQSGQAFFVQTIANANTNIAFNEACKTSNSTNAVFGSATNTTDKLYVNLQKQVASNFITVDGVLGCFGATYNKAVSFAEDADKNWNNEEIIYLTRGSYYLGIERRPYITNTDSLFINMLNLKVGSVYHLDYIPVHFDAATTAYLLDKATNTKTPILLTGNSNFSFTANATSNTNRYVIVFSNTTLPNNNITLSAKKTNTSVALSLSANEDLSVKNYIIEHSVSGKDFIAIKSLEAQNNSNNNSYSFQHLSPAIGNNYYKIKQISKADKIEYSNTVVVNFAIKNQDFFIYPNPITTNSINLQFEALAKANYMISIFDKQGKKVYQYNWKCDGQNLKLVLDISKIYIANGTYDILINNEATSVSKQIIIAK
jgi:CARDB/Secretion system C-terminal sorting domain